jgi:hypothetical protein
VKAKLTLRGYNILTIQLWNSACWSNLFNGG